MQHTYLQVNLYQVVEHLSELLPDYVERSAEVFVV